MQSKHEREQNKHLRAENEKLRCENMRYKEALTNACCPACGRMAAISDVSIDERQLRMENARLREEVRSFLYIILHLVFHFTTTVIRNQTQDESFDWYTN